MAGWLTDGGDDGATPPAASSAEEAAALIAAWERSLEGTYVVVSRFEREVAGEVRFESQTRVVQRPPDRLSEGAGSVDARLGGRRVACAADADGELRCRQGGAAAPYDHYVEERVQRIADAVTGDGALYSVRQDGDGCFELGLRRPIPAPPYGQEARFCFDDRTGAQVLSVIRRGDTVDRTVALEIRDEVTVDDLRVPDPGGE